jgi:hypothetical protein
MSVQLAKTVDVSKIRYSEVKTLSSGAKTVYVNYGNGTDKLTIQTPIMSIPYGINDSSKFAEKNAQTSGKPANTDKKYELTFSFRGMDDNDKLKTLHDKLKDIEKKIIDDAFDNRAEWFKDDYDGQKAFVAKMFTSIVKIDKDKNTGKLVGKYPPTFKARVPFDNKTERFTFDSYDMNGEEIVFEDFINKLKGAKCKVIIQLSGLWFAGGRFGCSWKITTGKFQLQQSSKPTFIAESDDEDVVNDDEEEDEEDVVVDSDVVLQSTPNKNEVDDGEDDEEEEDEDDVEEEEEPEPEPVKPTPKKKTPAPKKK